MFYESNCNRKSQLSGILIEPLNPCAVKRTSQRLEKINLKLRLKQSVSRIFFKCLCV